MRARTICTVASIAVVASCTEPDLPSGPTTPPTPSSDLVYAVGVSGPVTLGALDGLTYNIPYGINDAGDITGVSTLARSVVIWPTGAAAAPASTAPTAIDGPGAEGHDINLLGQIAGESGSHAALWSPNAIWYTKTDIGAQLQAQFGATQSTANGVNASGSVVGGYLVGSGAIDRCFLWTPDVPNGWTGTVIDLGDLGGGRCGANDINAAGLVAGASTIDPADPTSLHAFVWNGSLVDLAPTGGMSYGVAINDGGQVAGFRGATILSAVAAVWTPAGAATWSVLDLGAPALSGQTGVIRSLGLDINDAGFVVGFTVETDDTPVGRAFFWQNGLFTELPGSVTTFNQANALTNIVSNVVVVTGAGATLNTSIFRPLRWAVTLTPATPGGAIGQLMTQVEQMQSDGTLGRGDATAFLSKLDAASRQLAQGRTTPAKNLLHALINEVNASVAAGRLSSAQTQPLIDGAQYAIAAL